MESLPVVTVEVAGGAGAIGAKAGGVPLDSLIGGSVVADAGGGAVEFTAGSAGGSQRTTRASFPCGYCIHRTPGRVYFAPRWRWRKPHNKLPQEA